MLAHLTETIGEYENVNLCWIRLLTG